MPCSVSQTSSPVPTSAEWRVFLNSTSGVSDSPSSGPDEPGGLREDAFGLDMEDAHHRPAGSAGAVDQRLLVAEIGRLIDLEPAGALAERFLGIDDEQGSIGHFQTSWRYELSQR